MDSQHGLQCLRILLRLTGGVLPPNEHFTQHACLVIKESNLLPSNTKHVYNESENLNKMNPPAL